MDELRKFLFEGLAVRGVLVRLDASWRELLARRGVGPGGAHALAPPVRSLLGEMAAASCLMQANLKFDGALVLQVFGDGPVKLAVAEAQPDLGFRATAKVVGEIGAAARLDAMLNLHGQGRCAITLDPRGRTPGQQPYQGVVPLQDERGERLRSLADVLEHYMRQSEQLDTRIVLAAGDDAAAGLLIQRLPVAGAGNLAGPSAAGDDDAAASGEDFRRIALLAGTATAQELLELDPVRLLGRLFAEETVRVFDPLAPRFACSCSRERVAGMLRGLGREEVQSLIDERGEAEVSCDYCGAVYRFDPVDAGGLFTPGREAPPSSTRLQ